MLDKNHIIQSLVKWNSEFIEIIQFGEQHPILQSAYQANQWFHPKHILFALQAINQEFLSEENLIKWTNSINSNPKSIGIIAAGNIPLAAFHDILAVLAMGNIAVVKMSSKDDMLLPYFKLALKQISPELSERIVLTESLAGIDAIIATGSNNTNRYFEYYFGKLPHIFRKNRTSVAIISESTSQQELLMLGKDVFLYYGLGCRNISKIFLPEGFNIPALFDLWTDEFHKYGDHSKYRNNLDYHTAIYLLNNLNHFASEFIVMKEDESIHSPVGVLHYSFYNSKSDVQNIINQENEHIQCIVGEDYLPFGSTQTPSLIEYPDNINTLEFQEKI